MATNPALSSGARGVNKRDTIPAPREHKQSGGGQLKESQLSVTSATSTEQAAPAGWLGVRCKPQGELPTLGGL